MLDRFRRELIHPNIPLLRKLRPLAVRPGMPVVRARSAAASVSLIA
jgi:hypothetical protein